MEHWVEINLFADLGVQDDILLGVLWPHVKRLRRKGALLSFHYFREPEIRFRMRLTTELEMRAQERKLGEIAERLKRRGLVSKWNFGDHGAADKRYVGEEDRYGKNGWLVAQRYFEEGAEAALGLLDLKRKSKLENVLQSKSKDTWGWKGSDEWRARTEDPVVFHWSRRVHLFTNQLGYNIEDEAELCSRQAERYRQVASQGVRW